MYRYRAGPPPRRPIGNLREYSDGPEQGQLQLPADAVNGNNDIDEQHIDDEPQRELNRNDEPAAPPNIEAEAAPIRGAEIVAMPEVEMVPVFEAELVVVPKAEIAPMSNAEDPPPADAKATPVNDNRTVKETNEETDSERESVHIQQFLVPEMGIAMGVDVSDDPDSDEDRLEIIEN